MSDEIERDGAPANTPAGIWTHLCERPGCGKWGGYGYQIGRQTTHWYCRSHRDEGEWLTGRA